MSGRTIEFGLLALVALLWRAWIGEVGKDSSWMTLSAALLFDLGAMAGSIGLMASLIIDAYRQWRGKA